MLHVLEDLHGHAHPPGSQWHVADCQWSRRKHSQSPSLLRLTNVADCQGCRRQHTQSQPLVRLTRKLAHACRRWSMRRIYRRRAARYATAEGPTASDNSEPPGRTRLRGADPSAGGAVRAAMPSRRPSIAHLAREKSPGQAQKPIAQSNVDHGPVSLGRITLGYGPTGARGEQHRSNPMANQRKIKNKSARSSPIERCSRAGRAGERGVNPASAEA